MRIDRFLVENGYFDTRTKASEALKKEAILVEGKLVTKASFEVALGQRIEVVKNVFPYVSRGGIKLEAAIRSFHLDFKNKIVLDIGSSTGGFTDCALKFGAKEVYAVDVGSNQMDEALRLDPRIHLYEQTNILDVSFPISFDIIVMDVSFVSIEKLLPAIDRFLTDYNYLVCLIKPQFEIGKRYVKNGVVKERSIHIQVIEKVIAALEKYQMGAMQMIPSPILGGSGNKEFLAYIKKNVRSRVNTLKVCE